MHRAAVPARARRGLLRPLPAMDLPFLILVLTLVGFGLVMLYSASSAVALYRRGDAWAYVRPQLLYAAMGIGAMWAASRVDYHIYHKLAWPLLALSLVLLVVVLFMPEYNGCKRWLVLPGLGTLQPSEIAKFAAEMAAFMFPRGRRTARCPSRPAASSGWCRRRKRRAG
jgi:cell division protein FtsW